MVKPIFKSSSCKMTNTTPTHSSADPSGAPDSASSANKIKLSRKVAVSTLVERLATRVFLGKPRYPFTPENITSLEDDEIFVFGSNAAGRHGGGAARTAYQHFGAILGQGVGRQGHSYAIPTMGNSVSYIQPFVDDFMQYATEHQELFFLVTRIGCGIAGFTDKEVAPLFARARHLPNVCLPQSFLEAL